MKKNSSPGKKAVARPWMKHVGKLKPLRKETVRINGIIDEEFERIEPEMWR